MSTRSLAVVVAVVATALVSATNAQPAKAVTIDFSTAPQFPEPFPKDFYAEQGIVFTEGSNVGVIQGDEALGGAPTIAAFFTTPITSLSLEAAPAFQGTAEYTLTAFDQTGQAVASTATVVTQDLGDPADQGSGYFTVDLGTLPRAATSFTFRSRFIRSSFGTPNCGDEPVDRCFSYGVRTITFTAAPPLPTNRDQCRNGRWRTYGVFKNQGDCVSFVATGGKNPPAGP
jgi:hypothetical protein